MSPSWLYGFHEWFTLIGFWVNALLNTDILNQDFFFIIFFFLSAIVTKVYNLSLKYDCFHKYNKMLDKFFLNNCMFFNCATSRKKQMALRIIITFYNSKSMWLSYQLMWRFLTTLSHSIINLLVSAEVRNRS